MKREKLKEGFVQVYTGSGKGKTTAALGLALRAAGYGLRIFVLQFMKGNKGYGEVKAIKLLNPYIKIRQSGLCSFVQKNNPSREDKRLANKGFEIATKAVLSGDYDVLILDEINCALDFKLIELQKVLDLIEKKPLFVEMVLTGRNAPKELIEKAHLVTEMREIKHYYSDLHIESRKGIDL